ncbi:hypothetical protein [Sunxiuqinia dokdonensis]|uniref:Uncharacterized protein n=1 Tax=Sunxiuqinia dokdonensis TaxID=1409788 RepID=A0A0L8VCG3_9BACT|nr:hypothetical protein [Sunxiuqinia dokdonensis]KOH45887.1 hypothetical protein NC99_13190 [Sunxiuqinia dokdonensis]
MKIKTGINLTISITGGVPVNKKTNKPMKADIKNPIRNQEQKRSTTITIPHLVGTSSPTALTKKETTERRKRTTTIIIPKKKKM